MLRKISLKEDSPSGKELILPVTPASWQGEAGRKASSLTMHTVGAVNLPGSRVLLDEELDCLLPARDYSFNTPGAVTDPWYYLRQLIRWSNEGTVLRFIVSDTEMNEAVILDPIRYREQDGTNDIYCTIPLRGYRKLAAEATETASTGNNARAGGSAAATQDTYTVVAGDTLSAIARKFYGDASLYGKLAAANGIKNANLIYPGQALKIPNAKELPAAKVSSGGAGKAPPSETVTLEVVYTGSIAHFGSVYASYQLPGSSQGTRTVTNKDSFPVKTGGTVEITWRSKGTGRSDYLVLNGKQQSYEDGNRKRFSLEKAGRLYIHWTGLKL